MHVARRTPPHVARRCTASAAARRTPLHGLPPHVVALGVWRATTSLASSARVRGLAAGFEAAVCGGIPIIHTLQRDFLGDDIKQLSGIINGCTNYMLSSMSLSGKSYSEALAEASELGYAEADPTLDVGGFDARSKLKIMIKLAFGLDVIEDEIPCRGITEVTSTDFEYASTIGGTVKLLGIAKLDDAVRAAPN
jgi:homoserine dehydrogenase